MTFLLIRDLEVTGLQMGEKKLECDTRCPV